MSTVDKTEVEKFSKLASDWWNPNGKFKPLHLFNPARIKFIKEKLIYYFGLDPKAQEPLKKINILDIGCGGGLLCEPLNRLGAVMTGIDASIPVTVAPNLFKGSHTSPPPQPISKILIFFNGSWAFGFSPK